ncbi:transcriptional regulator, TetR family [Pelagirhabdus alkalitolerans]|uniref:Transcriptional regulator, TetR family n=1 Tax=Pelagirhabdus alkalitolerans TaxID=1612202 RepID=A0A1G6JNZ5_9BACI|nr:TetR/AcrR family transcriptional regulator [Pelagirhabdus alkalitolerans]SDC20459.1 transcriptional regulator, TetR family [Pelagirhabdus alkalitolerans]
MNEKFFSLPEEKQIRIINACMKEFSENGFKQASTNRMVETAGIGKGMLFYYFVNKKTLYHYLLDYGLNRLEVEFLDQVDLSETGFIERLSSIAKKKWMLFQKYPDLFSFLAAFIVSDQTEVPDSTLEKYKALQQKGQDILYSNIDRSLFRQDVDVDKVFKLIQWTLDGYRQEFEWKLKHQAIKSVDFEPYWQEFYEYLSILKHVYYKGES